MTVQRESVSYGLKSREECISIIVITEFCLLIINVGLCPKLMNLASTTAHIVLNVKGNSGFRIVNVHSLPKEWF